jgi:hypothetical protein
VTAITRCAIPARRQGQALAGWPRLTWHGACTAAAVLNNSLTAPALWTLRIALAAWLMNVENPFGLAAALAVLTVQVPIQRAVLAWDRRSRSAS